MSQPKDESLKLFLLTRPNSDVLVRFLPQRFSETLQKETIHQLPITTFLSPTHWCEEIHYTWFYETLKKMDVETQQLFFILLTPAQFQGIQKLSKNVLKKQKVPFFVVPFISSTLKKEMQPADILSLLELPESKLSDLLRLNRKEFLQLIDLLGLYDLAADLRQIVDKELLNKIYAALSQPMLHFLHYATKQPMKWIPPKLKLDAWNGAAKNLQQLLHKRGLLRLARAMIDEEKSFKWLFLHRLDVTRAQIMEKVFSQKYDRSLISYFKDQVLHILKRFKK